MHLLAGKVQDSARAARFGYRIAKDRLRKGFDFRGQTNRIAASTALPA